MALSTNDKSIQDRYAVAQHLVVKSRRGPVENQEVDIVAAEANHDLRDELRPVPECAFVSDRFIAVNRNVNVAVGLCPAERVRTEQMSLKYLRARFKQTRDSLSQNLAGFRLHVGSLHRKGKLSSAIDSFPADHIRITGKFQASRTPGAHNEVFMPAATMPPIHPGEILLEEFLNPLGVSQYRLAKDISVPPRRINKIVHGKRAVTPDTALRLARFFGTTGQFWLNLQSRYELELERDRLGERLQAEVRVLERVE